MQTIEELHAHYKAVRARLNGHTAQIIQFPIVKIAPEPEPEPEPIPNLSPANRIMFEVGLEYGLSIWDIKGKCRQLNYVLARHHAAYRIVNELKFSLPKTGRLMGNKDHTTILNAIRKHEKRLAKSREAVGEKSVSGDSGEEWTETAQT